MAYNLLVEFEVSPPWENLAAVAASLSSVEVFPVPERDGFLPGVGISVPRRGANEEGWKELQRLIHVARELNGRIFELYGGTEVSRGSEDELRVTLLG